MITTTGFIIVFINGNFAFFDRIIEGEGFSLAVSRNSGSQAGA